MTKLEHRSEKLVWNKAKTSEEGPAVTCDVADRSLGATVKRLLNAKALKPNRSKRSEHGKLIEKQLKAAISRDEDAKMDWLWRTGPDFRFIYLAEKTPGSLVGRENFALGKTRWELADTAEEPEMWRRHRADLENHRPFDGFLYRTTLDNGEVRYIESSGAPVFQDDGVFVGYKGTASDVTRRIVDGELAK